MKHKNEESRTRTNKKVDTLHWFLFLTVLSTITLGLISSRILSFQQKSPTILIHQILGSAVLLITIVMVSRMISKIKESRKDRKLANFVQVSQVITLMLIALSGLSIALMDTPVFGLYSWVFPEHYSSRDIFSELFSIHAVVIKVFASLISLHFLGALKHHFFDKGEKLNQMLGR